MSQQSDIIRPRRRTRTALPGVSRADQSTRVLIQVPLVSIGVNHPKRPSAGNALPNTRQLAKRSSGTTVGTDAGSETESQPPEPAKSVTAVESKNPAASGSEFSRTVRIDSAHTSASAAHAVPGWLTPNNGVLAKILQRNSLLATAVLVVVVGLVVVRISRPNNRGTSPEKKTLNANPAAVVEQNSGAHRSSDFKNSLDAKSKPTLPDERSGAERGKSTAIAPGNNPAGDASTAGPTFLNSNSGHLKGVRAPAIAPGNGAPNWNLPAATNAPATIEAQVPPANPNDFSSVTTDVSPLFYSARRDVPPLPAAGNRGFESTRGAAFEGGIERLPMQVSR